MLGCPRERSQGPSGGVRVGAGTSMIALSSASPALVPGPRPGGSSGTTCPITRATATPAARAALPSEEYGPPLTASLVMVSWSSADCGEEEGL